MSAARPPEGARPLLPGGGRRPRSGQASEEVTQCADVPRTAWPALPLAAWRDTCETLHLWLQIVGKVRLSRTPWVNHSWHVPLYVTPTGLTTSPIPHDAASFAIEFDFLRHRLRIVASDGGERELPLVPQTVAAFYARLMDTLSALGLPVTLHAVPNEIADAIPFAQDERHGAYDAEYARRYWRVLLRADRVLHRFRAGFVGKCSPVHFFWGSNDLAVTRFSGRTAPPHPGGIPNLPDWIAREAYSHEVASCGFWPGTDGVSDAAFYAYAYPEPPGFAASVVAPRGAFYSRDLHEFLLPYEALRSADDPDAALLAFCESTYAAAADHGHWDRAALERSAMPPP